MKTTLEQRLDTFQLHMEQREEHLTPEENREFLVRAIDDLQERLNKANTTPSPQDFQDALNILAKHRDDGYNDMAALEWLNKMNMRGIFPTPQFPLPSEYHKSAYDKYIEANGPPTTHYPSTDECQCPYDSEDYKTRTCGNDNS